MFELSVACKYLLPRRRQLSVSIISFISILVISLVVWLIVVFFSVTDGLEQSWIRKMTALTAPVRITPTEAYYSSYYYQVDALSHNSDYGAKTIGEKLAADTSDPYDPEIDQELPSYWAEADRHENGELKDLVKEAFQAIEEQKQISPGLKAEDYELTMSHIDLKLTRPSGDFGLSFNSTPVIESNLSYPAYLGNFSGSNPQLEHTLIPLRASDANNTLIKLSSFTKIPLNERLRQFWSQVAVSRLKSSISGWIVPREWLPSEAKWSVVAILQGSNPVKLIIPQKKADLESLLNNLQTSGRKVKTAELLIAENMLLLKLPGEEVKSLSPLVQLILQPGVEFPAELITGSIETAKKVDELQFKVEIPIQNSLLKGITAFRQLELAEIKLIGSDSPFWVHLNEDSYTIPSNFKNEAGILLPKGFKESGVLVGDSGTLSYMMPTASTVHEQRLPVYVAGFYDPGIIPIGGKFILGNRDLITLIRNSHNPDDKSALTNGINLHFDSLDKANEIKSNLVQAFKDRGIDRYWKVETYRDFEFTQAIMRELQSQKTLFTLIAVVIIVVACSNIISMLIILVNDKKMEIGILRSMGASSFSIALIFGTAGAAIGLLSSLVGLGAAIFTLDNLPTLMRWISSLQGHDLFQSAFYGEIPPQHLSYEALTFVLGATMAISLLAGIVPAVKACLLRPSQILRSAG